MAYLIDSDVFIEAKNRHYGFDFCPAFWDWLIQKHVAGDVFSVQKISDELTPANDDLAQWVTARGPAFFLPPDAQVIAAVGTATAWAAQQQTPPGQAPFAYTAQAQATFAGSGDIFLIAHALAKGHTVVTHEQAAFSPTRVKIPNACVALGVTCITPFAMLRQAAAAFVLPPPNAAAAALAAVAAVAPQNPLGPAPLNIAPQAGP